MAVRRPGCFLCREEAADLSSLKPRLDELGVPLYAVVKEQVKNEVKDFQPYFKGRKEERKKGRKEGRKKFTSVVTWSPHSVHGCRNSHTMELYLLNHFSPGP